MNRFYDKTLQFIVLPDGNAGFLGEHAIADGAPTLRMCAEILPLARQALSGATAASVAQLASAGREGGGFEELGLEGMQQLGGALAEARGAFATLVAEHLTSRIAVPALGSDAIKKLGVCWCDG